MDNAKMISKQVVEIYAPRDVDSHTYVEKYQSAVIENFGASTLMRHGVLSSKVVKRITTTIASILKAQPDLRTGTAKTPRTKPYPKP